MLINRNTQKGDELKHKRKFRIPKFRKAKKILSKRILGLKK